MPVKPNQPDLLTSHERNQMRHQLQRDLGMAQGEQDRAQWAQDPYEARFRAEHERLADMHARRGSNPDITRRAILAGHDARMHAGHAWHPHRQRLREAKRWVDEITKELRHYE